MSLDPNVLKIFHTAKLLEWKGVMVILRALTKLPEDVDLHKLAPWAMVARVLLNLDETITKE